METVDTLGVPYYASWSVCRFTRALQAKREQTADI